MPLVIYSNLQSTSPPYFFVLLSLSLAFSVLRHQVIHVIRKFVVNY